MTLAEPSTAAGTTQSATTPAYARYALGLLLGVVIFNFIDRHILSILIERYALVSIVSIGNAWAATHYFIAARSLRADLAAKDRA